MLASQALLECVTSLKNFCRAWQVTRRWWSFMLSHVWCWLFCHVYQVLMERLPLGAHHWWVPCVTVFLSMEWTSKNISCDNRKKLPASLKSARIKSYLFHSFKISFHFISFHFISISGYDALRTFFFFLTYFWLWCGCLVVRERCVTRQKWRPSISMYNKF